MLCVLTAQTAQEYAEAGADAGRSAGQVTPCPATCMCPLLLTAVAKGSVETETRQSLIHTNAASSGLRGADQRWEESLALGWFITSGCIGVFPVSFQIFGSFFLLELL